MTYDSNNNNPPNLDQLNQIKPSYLAAYGLVEAPFSSQQDDRFFYANAELTERLELLKHYIQYGNLLIIIAGERGSGKSSLKQHFVNTAQEEWQICEIQSHTMMDASLLLKQVAHGFNITEPPLEPTALLEVLSSQLDYMHQASYEPILIIDDAHELPQDALQALLYLAEHHSDKNTTLRIILFCEPEIEVMLEDPAIHSLKERITHSMEIPLMDETQTAEYLRHRLAVAGLDGTSPFTPKLIHKIFKASGGLPAKVNEYAHQNLLDDSEPVNSDELNLDAELIQETPTLNLHNMILGGFALTIVIAGLLFQDRINSLFEEPVTVTTENKVEKNINNETFVQKTVRKTTQAETSTKEQPVKEIIIELSLNKDSKIKEINTENIKKELPIIKLAAIIPPSITGSKQRQIISVRGTGFNKRQKIKISWSGNEKILAQTQVNFASDTYLNLILNVGTQKDTWKVTLIDPQLKITSNTISFDVVSPTKDKIKEKIANPVNNSQPVKATTKVTAVKAELKTGLYGPNWIRQQNKNHYTLQLLGTHQQSALPAYIKKFALKNDAAMFNTTRNSKDWFTLIYNHYPTKAAAEAAAKKLPKGMSKPWIRSFASILPSLKTKQTVKNIPTDQEGWIWSQDPSHYTLQLAAGTDKTAIQSLIKRHNLYGKAVYFHRLRDGKDWYILVHGSYSDSSKAKQAIKQLPLAVQKGKPWLRKFSAIHAELN